MQGAFTTSSDVDGYIICIKLCQMSPSHTVCFLLASQTTVNQFALRALTTCVFKLTKWCFIAAELHAYPFPISLLSSTLLLRIP